MQITDPFNNPRLFIEQTRSETLNQLRSGQTVTAQVIKPATNGVAQIDIGGIKLPVQTGVKLEIGQQLALNVIKGGKAPELQLIRNTTPEAIQALTLKRILPQQLPIHQLLDTLKTLSESLPIARDAAITKENMIVTLVRQLLQLSGSAGTQPTMPQQAGHSPSKINLQNLMTALQNATNQPTTKNGNNHLNQLASQISQVVNNTLPGNSPITAATIHQAFQQSGLFLESRLMGNNPLGTDFKASLLKLIAELQTLATANPVITDSAIIKAADTATTLQLLAARIFSELQQLTEGTLARVQMHQLASLPQEESNLRQVWQFELPVPHADGHDDFFIQLEKEDNQADSSEVRWSVTLNFDIPPAGPISAKLNLAGDVISSHFTAERAEGVSRLEQTLPKLSAAFEKAGLIVGRLSAHQGKTIKIHEPPPQPFPLLDEKA
ncbi:flagellar hook-length control protein FliK [Sedimenticola selenatireducens]|nr:flagellar hook-length control protein FliK [Sedimenticola selenatireducens]